LRHLIVASIVTAWIFLGGPSLGIFGHAPLTLEFPKEETKLRAESVVAGPSAAAQAGCAAMGGARLKSTNGTNANVVKYIGLGHLDDGNTAEITLGEIRITADSYTPDVLRFSLPPDRNGAEFIMDDSRASRRILIYGTPPVDYMSQPIRQIKAPEVLLDIIVTSQWEYELRFYRPNQIGAKRGKIYQLIGDPFSVYRFRNPNPPAVNRLEITAIKDGTETRDEYFYDAGLEFWSLTRNGREVARKTSRVNPHNPCERIETRFETEGSKVVKTLRFYKGFPWGQEVVKNIEDPEGEARTTIYKYFDDPNRPHYTFLKTTINPDGTVEQHNQQPDPTMHFRKQPQ
jgi:hypothetical protein